MWTDKIWLTVETSSFCNYSCPYCSQHNYRLKDKRFLKLDEWKKIIDDFINSKRKISNLNPFYRGEPLLNPEFGDMIYYFLNKSRQFLFCDFIVIHTNGFFLEDENLKAILRASNQQILPHPNDLFISLDASNAETYRKIRKGGDFNRVVSNIKNFLIHRKKLNQFGPNIVLQYIISKKNVDEVSDFYKFAMDLFCKYSHKPVDIQYSKDNSPWRVKTDTIYYRVLEGERHQFENNREVFFSGLKKLKKNDII
ncbi:MAG: radical SAM protein [Candidatus Muiribacteriota bacterium]